jgi:hypothetical protein
MSRKFLGRKYPSVHGALGRKIELLFSEFELGRRNETVNPEKNELAIRRSDAKRSKSRKNFRKKTFPLNQCKKVIPTGKIMVIKIVRFLTFFNCFFKKIPTHGEKSKT